MEFFINLQKNKVLDKYSVAGELSRDKGKGFLDPVDAKCMSQRRVNDGPGNHNSIKVG